MKTTIEKASLAQHVNHVNMLQQNDAMAKAADEKSYRDELAD